MKRSALPALGIAAGAWALLPPYSGPYLATSNRVEVADHVVPGVLLLVVSVTGLLMARRPQGPGEFLFVAGLAVVLAGIWMTATHVPLVLQAARDEAPVGAVVYHTLPGLAVLALGVVWASAHWKDTA